LLYTHHIPGTDFYSLITLAAFICLTHFSFYPADEPISECSWDNFNPDADMFYMTNWVAQQMGDTKKFIWDINIAGRQYHFDFDWGAAGVYYDFKDGSFSCIVNYK